MHFFEKKFPKNLVISKKSSTFAPAFEKEQLSGAVVQLVRIPACHAVGREFESRPHRKARKNAGFVIVVRTNLPKLSFYPQHSQYFFLLVRDTETLNGFLNSFVMCIFLQAMLLDIGQRGIPLFGKSRGKEPCLHHTDVILVVCHNITQMRPASLVKMEG